MPKRPPYLEFAVTAAVLTFLALVIVGSFDQRTNNTGQVTLRAD